MTLPTLVSRTAASRGLALAVLLALSIVAWSALPRPVMAQQAEIRALADEVQRLQRELTTLQQDVYRSGAVTSGGDGDTESYGASQAERFDQRLRGLEKALRDVTGQIEQQTYSMDQLTRRFDKLVADVDLRLQNIERRLALTADGGGEAPADLGGSAQGVAASQLPASSGATTAAASASGATANPQPGVLGTISPEDLAAVEAQGAAGGQAQATGAASGGQAVAALPSGTAQQQYDDAFRLLSQARYDEAETALSNFLQAHPQDDLAGNAKYWLGETYYVRGQFAEAAVTFAEGYQEFPNSVKAPDNLLKLGKSLAELGQNADACATFSELLKRYNQASPTILQQAKRDKQRLACG